MSCLTKKDKIFVAGHRGLVGSAIHDVLKQKNYSQIVTKTRDQLDLLNQQAVMDFYKAEKPDVVFIAAAKVGGIHANNQYRADFIYENVQIQTNLIWGAHLHNVRRLVFLGSSCIYPRNAAQPMAEDCMLTSELEMTNRPYALAKIAGVEMVNTLRQQYQRDYFSAMPTNLYGPRDNFHPENSHVLPALLRRFVEAKQSSAPSVKIWGTGTPKREFLYAQDCADAIVHLTESVTKAQFDELQSKPPHWSHINIGSGEEVSIRDLAHLIAEVSGYRGEVVFDSTKPDGTMRKLLDVSRLTNFGWKKKTTLHEGVKKTLAWYMENK